MVTEKFKVMFLYLNDRMRTTIPLNISLLSANLKKAGFPVFIFDTSFYAEQERINEEQKKEEAGIFQSVDYESIGVKLKYGSLMDDFLASIREEKPSLLCFSPFSQSKEENFEMARRAKELFPELPIVFGGIHTNIEPMAVLSREYIDFVCLGEGEEAMVELAQFLADNKNVNGVRNICYKEQGQVKMNGMRPVQNMDDLPFPDWDSFEEYHQYGPYRGKLLRMALVEYSRTCPYKCTYCGNSVIRDQYKANDLVSRNRHKSPRHWINELKRMKEEYGVEFLNIVDGTFLSQRVENLEEIAELYIKEINLPFFADATVHCIKPRKAELLKEMGCECINMGLESGDEEYRKKYLDRTMSNEKMIKAFLMAREAGLDTRSFNIIGMPYETPEMIEKTIELNRKCKVGSVSMSIFMPYEGTALRELCIRDGLISKDQHIPGDGTYPIIKNPYMTDEELLTMYNRFANQATAWDQPASVVPSLVRTE